MSVTGRNVGGLVGQKRPSAGTGRSVCVIKQPQRCQDVLVAPCDLWMRIIRYLACRPEESLVASDGVKDTDGKAKAKDIQHKPKSLCVPWRPFPMEGRHVRKLLLAHQACDKTHH